jgi:hypothetical protein
MAAAVVNDEVGLAKEQVMMRHDRKARNQMIRRRLLIVLIAVTAGLFFLSAARSRAACDYLAEDFSVAGGWTASMSTGHWAYADGTMQVEGISENYVTYASTSDFTPPDFFSVDVDISMLATSDQYDAVGLYVRNTPPADAMDLLLLGITAEDGVTYSTDRIGIVFYPARNEVKFLIYDLMAGVYKFGQPFHAVSGSVTSIGLTLMADGAVIRVNGRDTAYKLPVDFSILGARYFNTLRLVAKGTGLQARFDNICAGPVGSSGGEVPDFPAGSAMPLPVGIEVFAPAPAAAPASGITPAAAVPLGFGTAATGGATLSLRAAVGPLAGPANLYVGLQSDVLGTELYLFNGAGQLVPYSTAGLVPWRSSTTGAIGPVALLGDVPTALLPAGVYHFYFLMTPTGNMNAMRLWSTDLTIGGGGVTPTPTPPAGDSAMEQDIRGKLDLILGLGSAVDLSALTALFEDESVVTTAPAELSLAALMSGAPITISANFPPGYRMDDGSSISGSALIRVSNVVFNSAGLGADITATFTNIVKDGAPFANGGFNGSVSLSQGAGDSATVSGFLTFNNFELQGMRQHGTINISGNLTNLNLSSLTENTGTVRLTFSSFTSGDYVITGGTVDITLGGTTSTADVNLETSDGPVDIGLRLVQGNTTGSMVINSVSPGTVGPYTVSISDLRLDTERCGGNPAGGTITFTSAAGTTADVTFDSACDGGYAYRQR